jgi:hypothetical protein
MQILTVRCKSDADCAEIAATAPIGVGIEMLALAGVVPIATIPARPSIRELELALEVPDRISELPFPPHRPISSAMARRVVA